MLICAMVRLAAVSKDGGVPLVLDDALGSTDEGRLEAMGAVLAWRARIRKRSFLRARPNAMFTSALRFPRPWGDPAPLEACDDTPSREDYFDFLVPLLYRRRKEPPATKRIAATRADRNCNDLDEGGYKHAA